VAKISKLKNRKYYIDFDKKCICDELRQLVPIKSPRHLALLLQFAYNAGSRYGKDFYIERCWDGGDCSEENWYGVFSRLRHLHSSLDESFDSNRTGILYLGTPITPPKPLSSEEELVETELSDVKNKLADLVESLMKQEDIFPQLQGIVALCRRLNLPQSKEFVLKKIQTCKKLAEKSGQYDDRTLSFLEYLEDYISVHVRLTEILREIGQNNEELFAARTIERRQRLSRTNFDLQQHYSKELTALMEYDQELERIQSNGISKDSMLSLSKPYFSNDP